METIAHIYAMKILTIDQRAGVHVQASPVLIIVTLKHCTKHQLSWNCVGAPCCTAPSTSWADTVWVHTVALHQAPAELKLCGCTLLHCTKHQLSWHCVGAPCCTVCMWLLQSSCSFDCYSLMFPPSMEQWFHSNITVESSHLKASWRWKVYIHRNVGSN
jgi:hypothetical protein